MVRLEREWDSSKPIEVSCLRADGRSTSAVDVEEVDDVGGEEERREERLNSDTLRETARELERRKNRYSQ